MNQEITAAEKALPNPTAPVETIQSVRERVLFYLMVIASGLGVVAGALAVPEALRSGNIRMAAIYSGAIAFALVITYVRRLPYSLRSYSLVLIIYGLGLSSVLERGLNGDGRVFLVVLPVIAVALLGTVHGVAAAILSLATVVVVGLGMVGGQLPMPDPSLIDNSAKMSDWYTSAALMAVLSTLSVGALAMLLTLISRVMKQQSALSAQVEEERASLQATSASHREQLDHRSVQIRTAGEISRSISVTMEPQALLDQIVNVIGERFELYYVGVFLVDERRQNAVLRAGTGEAGRAMLADKHHLPVGESSMIGWCVMHRQARIALDVGQDAVRFNNPHLPLTRSEMALPLIARDEAIGALTLQSSQPEAFDQDDIAVLQSIADVLATSLENSRLYRETKESLNEIRTLHQKYLETEWGMAAQRGGALEFVYEESEASSGSSASVELPLTLRDQVIGQITLETGGEQLTDEERAFVESIVTQTGLALENARLLEETQRQVSREQMLNEMSTQFSRVTLVEDVLKTAARQLGKLASVTEASVYLLAPDERHPAKSFTE